LFVAGILERFMRRIQAIWMLSVLTGALAFPILVNAQDASDPAVDIRQPDRAEQRKLADEIGKLNLGGNVQFLIEDHAEIIDILNRTYGPDNVVSGRLIYRLGRNALAFRDYERASAHYGEAKRILAGALGVDHPDLMWLELSEIAILNWTGQHKEQLRLSTALLMRIETDYADQPVLITQAQSNLANAHYKLGDFAASEAIDRALYDSALAKHGSQTTGVQYPMTALVYDLLALGKPDEARALFNTQNALESLDPETDGRSVASLLRADASIRESVSDLDGARDALTKAHKLYSAEIWLPYIEKPIRPEPRHVLAVSSALDVARLENRKFSNSEGFWAPLDLRMQLGEKEAYSSQLFLDRPPEITDRLSLEAALNEAIDKERGDIFPIESEPFYRAVVEAVERNTGATNPHFAKALQDLGRNLLLQGKPFSAEKELLRVLEIQQASLEPDHPEISRTRVLLAKAYRNQTLKDLAVEQLQAALPNMVANPSPSKLELFEASALLDTIYAADREYDARDRLWDAVAGVLSEVDPYLAFPQFEARLLSFERYLLYLIEYEGAPPAEIVSSFEELAENLNTPNPVTGKVEILGPFRRSALLLDRILAEVYFARDEHDKVAEILFKYEDPWVASRLNEEAPIYAQRVNRWAEMLVSAPDVTTSQKKTIMAARWLDAVENMMEFRMGQASSGGDDIDSRQRRLFIAQGAGLQYRYSLSTRLQANYIHGRATLAAAEENPEEYAGYLDLSGFEDAFHAAQLLRIDRNSQTMARSAARAAAPTERLSELARELDDVGDALFQDKYIDRNGGETTGGKSLDALTLRYAEIDREIKLSFPEYYEFAAPEPLGFWDVRKRLADDEGVLLITPAGDDVYIFAISNRYPADKAWHRIEGGREEVEFLVSMLRCDLDPVECGLPSTDAFDRESAWKLYDMLIAPVAGVFDKQAAYNPEMKRVYVVTSGAISALPLSVLLTEKPDDRGAGLEGLRDAPWLGNKFDMVYLPSISDLRPVRGDGTLTAKFTGYGDPAIGEVRSEKVKPDDVMKRSRGGPVLASRDALKGMNSLPGTARELKAIKSLFSGNDARVFLQENATETQIKSDKSIGQSGIVVLSTHGVLPSIGAGFAEPGLVFSPPENASSFDDGLLLASEAATLELTAQLVILSACNTASAGQLENADGLSGLARSFLYSGAHSLYASHWRVSDAVTEQLIVTAIGSSLADPKLTRSEALAIAMRSVRSGEKPDGTAYEGWDSFWSHPASWAPFVTISGSETLTGLPED
jgi:CHAT domain-containing protein